MEKIQKLIELLNLYFKENNDFAKKIAVRTKTYYDWSKSFSDNNLKLENISDFVKEIFKCLKEEVGYELYLFNKIYESDFNEREVNLLKFLEKAIKELCEQLGIKVIELDLDKSSFDKILKEVNLNEKKSEEKMKKKIQSLENKASNSRKVLRDFQCQSANLIYELNNLWGWVLSCEKWDIRDKEIISEAEELSYHFDLMIKEPKESAIFEPDDNKCVTKRDIRLMINRLKKIINDINTAIENREFLFTEEFDLVSVDTPKEYLPHTWVEEMITFVENNIDFRQKFNKAKDNVDSYSKLLNDTYEQKDKVKIIYDELKCLLDNVFEEFGKIRIIKRNIKLLLSLLDVIDLILPNLNVKSIPEYIELTNILSLYDNLFVEEVEKKEIGYTKKKEDK